ncbi:MAG: MerR family transcriptional regulator [bacterium]
MDWSRGVYSISVAAELVGSTAQNLRLYEARGLLTPARTDGGTRRYSAEDVDRLREIARLLREGLNLAGVEMVLQLRTDNTRLNGDNTRLAGDNTRLRSDNRALRNAARPTRERTE